LATSSRQKIEIISEYGYDPAGEDSGMTTPTGTELIDVAAAAKALRLSGRQVRNLIAGGLLPARRIGWQWVISRADLAKVPKVRKPGPKRGEKRSGGGRKSV
jgi:hypothetical protein